MPEKLQTHTVVSEGGLQTQLSALLTGKQQFNGYADELINFEPGKGYRRLSGYATFANSTGLPVARTSVAGITVWNNLIVAAVVSNNATYDLFTQAPGGSGWTNITSAAYTFTPGHKIRFQTINFGTVSLVWVDGTNTAKLWNGSSVTAISGTGTPSAPSVVCWFQSHIVLAGDSSNPSIVYISAANTITDFNGADNAVSFNVGDTIIQVKAHADTLYIFSQHSIWNVVGNSFANFVLDYTTMDLGMTAPDSVQEVGGDLYFWAADGIRPISATSKLGDVNIGSITVSIRPTITSILVNNNPNNIISCQVRNKSQYRIFFSNSSGTQAGARGILGGQNITSAYVGSAYTVTRWEWGQVIGINPCCAASGYINGSEYVVHGGWDGNVYQQEVGNNFNGTAIAAVYRTPFMDMTDPMVRKDIQKIYAYLLLEGNVTVYATLQFDYNDVNVNQPPTETMVLQFSDSVYDDPGAMYGNSATLWGITAIPRAQLVSVGSGKTVALQLVSVDDQAPFSVQGFTLQHTIEGRD